MPFRLLLQTNVKQVDSNHVGVPCLKGIHIFFAIAKISNLEILINGYNIIRLVVSSSLSEVTKSDNWVKIKIILIMWFLLKML